MRIAVAYENGKVFQHFGKTENFKIYEVEKNQILSSEIISSNGEGHGALAGVLAENGVDIVICGGMGEGAQKALMEAGILPCSGAEGDADEAVISFLNGGLEDDGVNCDHHSAEGGCGSSCGGGCGGCGGGCHAPMIEGKNVGKNCKVHYRGTFNDGTEFDSSYNRGEPLEFVCGLGMMIKGFDKAVADMEVGEKVDIHLMPEEAYGMPDPEAILEIDFEHMPGSEELEVGEQVYLQNAYGQSFPVKVIAKSDKSITFDANHEMAGKELNFMIELVEVSME